MKTLNVMETHQVAGGLEAVGVLTALTCLNLGLAIYNTSRIDTIKSIMIFDEEILDFVYNWTIYQEAQLIQLPHHDEVSALSFDAAYALTLRK